jgi:transcriptional regulator with XRE-family HTH domain
MEFPKLMEKIFLNTNLKLLRKEFKVSQEDFSRIIGKKNSVVGTYEAGISKPPLEVLLIISNYFGVDLNTLVTTDMKEACIFQRDKNGNVVVLCGNDSGDDSKSEKSLPQKTLIDNQNTLEEPTIKVEHPPPKHDPNAVQNMELLIQLLKDKERTILSQDREIMSHLRAIELLEEKLAFVTRHTAISQTGSVPT